MTGSDNNGLAGACACGAVQYRLTASPLIVHCCHCRWCQRETGSAFVINALIETERIVLTRGAPESVHTPSASGRGQDIARCAACRVALWSHYPGLGPAVAFLRAGTLNAPDGVQPDVHIFTSTRLPWIRLPEDVPAFDEFYRLRDVWTADRLARLRRVSPGH